MNRVLRSRVGSWLFSALLLAWSVLVVFGTLEPFRFETDPVLLNNRAEPIEWIPLTYICPICGIKGWVKDKVLNLGIFLPFGFLASVRTGRDERRPRLGRIVFWGFLLSLSIEICQYFIPARSPSASDLLFNTLGAFAGGWLGWRLLKLASPQSEQQPDRG